MRAVSEWGLENYGQGRGARPFPELQAAYRVRGRPVSGRPRQPSGRDLGPLAFSPGVKRRTRRRWHPNVAEPAGVTTRRRQTPTGDDASCAPPRQIIRVLLLPMRFPISISGKQRAAGVALSH